MKPRMQKSGIAWICWGDGRVTLSRSAAKAYSEWKAGKNHIRIEVKP